MTHILANLIIRDLRSVSDCCQEAIADLNDIATASEPPFTPFTSVKALEDTEKRLERAKTRLVVLCDCLDPIR